MIIKYQIDRDYSHFPRIDTHLKLIFVKILLQFVKEKTAKFMRYKIVRKPPGIVIETDIDLKING